MSSSNKGFFYVLLLAVLSTFFAFLFGSNGIELFYVASIGTFFIFTWLLIQLVRSLYHMKTWLIIKLILTVVAAALLFLVFVITIASWPVDIDIVTNWWIVLVGVLPFIIPRLGVYKKINKTNKLSAGLLVSVFSIILFFMAANILRNNPDSLQQYALVFVVQAQFIFTYIVLQTHYIERSVATVVSMVDKRFKGDRYIELYALIFTAGLPLLVPVVALFWLSL